MAHLTEANFYEWVFDGSAPSTAERSHLEQCTACQAQLAGLYQLAGALQIARASEPSPAALARYAQLYPQVQQAPSFAQRLTEFIVAQLQWDGRQQPAWQGVRNTQVASYRLLYATAQAEIELLVAPREGRFQIEGEVIPRTEPTTLLPARCELHDSTRAELIDTTDCQADGRFHLAYVPTGQYRLAFVPANGPTLVIDDLELQ